MLNTGTDQECQEDQNDTTNVRRKLKNYRIKIKKSSSEIALSIYISKWTVYVLNPLMFTLY